MKKANTNLYKRISELEKRLAELKACWPAHSVKPQMVIELEELEDELERLKVYEKKQKALKEDD